MWDAESVKKNMGMSRKHDRCQPLINRDPSHVAVQIWQVDARNGIFVRPLLPSGSSASLRNFQPIIIPGAPRIPGSLDHEVLDLDISEAQHGWPSRSVHVMRRTRRRKRKWRC